MASPVVTLTYPLPGASSPAKFLNSKNPVISWDFSDADNDTQASIQVEIYKYAGHLLVWDSGEIVITEDMDGKALMNSGLLNLWSTRFYEIPDSAGLRYDVDYTVRMRVKDSSGTWSAFTSEARFILDTTAPMGVTVEGVVDLAAMRITWITSSVESIEGYNILRSSTSGGVYRKLNKDPLTSPEFIDRKVGARKTYFYRIQTVSDGGNVSEMSAPVAGSVDFKEWYLETMRLDTVIDFQNKRDRAQSKRTVLGPGGSVKRVVQDRGFLPGDMSITFNLLDDEISSGAAKYEQLLQLLNNTQLFSLRDPFGRQWTFSPGAMEETMLLTGSLEFEIKIDLSEVIE
jgi:hypothetical protein